MKGFCSLSTYSAIFEQRQVQVALILKPLVLKLHRIGIHGIISQHNLNFLLGFHHDYGNGYRTELIFH